MPRIFLITTSYYLVIEIYQLNIMNILVKNMKSLPHIFNSLYQKNFLNGLSLDTFNCEHFCQICKYVLVVFSETKIL